MKPTTRDRLLALIRQNGHDLTLTAIAKRLGVSRTRITQLLREEGYELTSIVRKATKRAEKVRV